MRSTRRYRAKTWLLASAMLVLGARDSNAQDFASIPGDPVAGRRFFVEHDCIRCHSIWGNGGTLGPDFATLGTGRSLQQLAGLFWNHTPRMIETVRERGFEWPQFSEEELADIISYVYYVKLFDEPGDPELGDRWFREKRCIACHSVGGSGGRSGGALDGYASFIAPVALAQGMWNHGPGMQSRQAASGIPMPTFLGREIADLQAFLRRASTLRGREVELLPPPNPNRGRSLFAVKGCSACHGTRGSGTAFGPDLREATQHMRVSEIAGRLWNHSARMVSAVRDRGLEFPRFEGTEMADVIAFLYYLRFYETEGDVQRGEELFMQKGCSTCHALDGGASIGPDLTGVQSVLTALGLATAMWNHAPAMYDLAQVQQAEWPVFEGNEMRDLSAYLQDVASSQGAGPGSEPEPEDRNRR